MANTRPLNTQELKQEVEDYQSGGNPPSLADMPQLDLSQYKIRASQQPAMSVNLSDQTEQPLSVLTPEFLRRGPRGTYQENLNEQGLQAGFGRSKYDVGFEPGMDIEQMRALNQSSWAKVGSGLLKGGITALTTAANTVAGTVWGVGSSLFYLGQNLLDGDPETRPSALGAFDAGVNNWLSDKMMNIQKWADEAIPNYRTEQERSEQYQREWWKPSHFFSANNIGDSILKNYGFTVGAMLGGMAWSRVIGKLQSAKLANDVMKGVVAASEGDASASKAMQEAAAAIKAGSATEAQEALARAGEAVQRGSAVAADADKLVENIKNAARQINKMDAKLQLYGAVVGAMGEGTVEGQMARQEFMDDYMPKLEAQKAREYQGLEQRILETRNPDWVEMRSVIYPDGTKGFEPVRLTDAGRRHLLVMQRQLVEKYDDLAAYANEQGDRLATTTFLLNLPVLTTSNLIQFGRMFSGGWKTNRAANARIRGGVKMQGGAPLANYAAEGDIASRTILGSLKVMGSESFEEMAQGTISSGAKQVADSRISAFNDAGYDVAATNSVRHWFEQMSQGGRDYLGDVKNWQEGALGALTGLLGVPGKRWGGGVIGEYQEARDQIESDRAAATALNNTINSKEFQDRWHGYIRHLKYDNDMADAEVKDDEYAWHTGDQQQLISDVIMFADAGKLEDLNQIVSNYGNITERDAASLREVLKGDENEGNDWVKNASDKEIVDRVKKQADKMAKTIQEYKDIYDAISTRAPQDASPEFIKEMVFTAQNIKAFDERFLTMFGETMNEIEPILLAMSSLNAEGETISEKESVEKFKVLRSAYEQLYAGSLLPLRLPKILERTLNSQLEVLDELTKEEDPKLHQKVLDMKKLSDDRKNFYRKLQTMTDSKTSSTSAAESNPSEDEENKTLNEQGQKDFNVPAGNDNKTGAQKKFEKEAVTTEKVAEEAEKAQSRLDTSGLDTFDKVKTAYLSKSGKDRVDFLQALEAVGDSNPNVSRFLKMKRRVDGFKDYIAAHPFNSMIARYANNMIDDILNHANSEQEIINLPDNVFTPWETFSLRNRNIMRVPGGNAVELAIPRESYVAVKNAIKEAMKAYLSSESATASRAAVDNPVPEPAPETIETPAGYDASQPGSVEPAPAAPTAPATTVQEFELEKHPVVRAAFTSFKGFRDDVTEVGYIDQNEYPFIRFERNGRKFMITFNLNTKGKVKGNLSEYNKDSNTYKPYNAGDRDKSFEQSQKAVSQYVPDGFIDLLQRHTDDHDGTIDERQSRYNKELRDKFNIYYLNTTLLGSKYEASDPNINRIKEELLGQNASVDEASSVKPTEDVVVRSTTEDDLIDSENDTTEESAETANSSFERAREGGRGASKYAYYRTSVPEIDSKEAENARIALKLRDREALKKVDLLDFVKKHPEYSDVWNALHDAGAFRYIATELKIGDEVSFIIDPAFPLYNNKPQVLMATRVGDRWQILTPLSSKIDDYYGLDKLRDAINKEYSAFIKTHPNEVFVFSKTTRVWQKRAGLIDYDFTLRDEKGIRNIPGYEGSSIVFITRNGEARVVKGEKTNENGDIVDQVSSTFSDPGYNRSNKKPGKLFLLTKNNNNTKGEKLYTPIGLNIRHFNESTKDLSNPTFDKIRGIIEDIAAIAKEADPSNVADKGSKLSDKVDELQKLLDLHNVDFVLKNFGGEVNGVALAVNVIDSWDSETNKVTRNEEKSRMFRPSQISAEKLLDHIASLDKSLQVRYDEATGTLSNLDDFINQNLVTSNARSFIPKGVDFYVDPYNPTTKSFGPVTQEQIRQEKEASEPKTESPQMQDNFEDGEEDSGEVELKEGAIGGLTINEDEATEALGQIGGQQDRPSTSSPESKEKNGVTLTSEQAEDVLKGETLGDPIVEMVNMSFMDLPAEAQDALTHKGWSEDEWDDADPGIKYQVLQCVWAF